ncbi:MAG: histidine triad nucleotide-binding protein [Patescibacteria group bacterium]|nr:histidine triad nucleotide-binding protein [Patescibacteria group bacterium]
MDDCVFCNIINRTIESAILFENDRVIVIRDILPKAPVHLLVISKEHIVSLNHLEPRHKDLVWDIISTAKEMARQQQIADPGFKLVVNVGRDGGQVIPHLHVHVMGGKKFSD